MSTLTRQKEYLTDRISTASPMELIRILYEAGIQKVDEAADALRAGDILTRGRAINKVIDILSELSVSLRRDAHEQYSNTLAELYSYMQHQLIRAHREQSEPVLLEVSRLLTTLLEGWVGAMDELQAAGGSFDEPAEHATLVNVPNPYSMRPAPMTESGRSWQF